MAIRNLAIIGILLAPLVFLSCDSHERTSRPTVDERTVGVGGTWVVRTHARLPEAGSTETELWYGNDERVARIVHAYRYYGDDCVAYDSPDGGIQHDYFTCGRHSPLILGPDSRATWDFEQDALQQRGIENSTTAIDHGDQRLSIPDAKRLANAQPLRGSQ